MKYYLERYLKEHHNVIMLIEPPYDLSSWTLIAKFELFDDKKQFEAYIKENLGYILEFSL